MENVKTIAVNAAVIIVICLLMLVGNTYFRQHQQFNKGEAALGRGDFIAAIAGYESAIHMYTPGSSTVRISAEKLWALGNAFESAGDKQKALIAYRSLRSSFYSAQGLFTPGMEWIARCDDKIALLTGKPAHGSSR